MLNSLNLKILLNISEKEFQKNSDLIIQSLLSHFSIQLDLQPYQKDIRFIISKKNNSDPKDVFRIGVNRYTQNKTLVVEIYEKYIKFLPFIILREIYNLFVPIELSNYESVQLVINQIIINNLLRHEFLDEWKSLIQGNLEHYDAPSKGFDRLTSFDRLISYFNLKGSGKLNPIRFFFHYIRKNKSLMSDKIEDATGDIHIIFFKEFEKYILKSMINDDMVETIRCLIYIFYETKHYKNLVQYHKYFQEFKTNNQLHTELSLRKFVKNMEWIKNESYIAGSYQVNWKAINTCVIHVYFRFDPILNKAKIYKIIKDLPFFLKPKVSRSSFNLDLSGYIVIPKIYLNDLIQLVKKLENLGYIIKHHLLLFNFLINILNLNYFRKYSQKQLIIDPNHSKYKKNYEIKFNLDYGIGFCKPDLDLLDFLLLDRIRFYSVTGLGFERRVETLQTLKSDLLNEISTERTKIKDLKNILGFFHKTEELKTEFSQFLEINKNFGFFYIRMMLQEYIAFIELLEGILMKNPEITNISQIQNILANRQHSHSIEDNIILNTIYGKNVILKEIISVYFSSKELYKKNIQKYRLFYALLNSCYNLRLFDLNAIKEILKDKNLVNTIYKKKEEKLKDSYEKYKLYTITGRKIDDILDKFLDHDPPIIKPNLIGTMPSTLAYTIPHLILIDSPETRKKLNLIENLFILSIICNTTDLITNKNYIYVEIRVPFLNNNEKELLYSILYNYFKEHIVDGKSYLGSGITPAFSLKNFYDLQTKQFFYTKDFFKQYSLYIQKLLGEPLQPLQEKSTSHEKFWSREKNISNLIKKVNDRVLREHIDFSIGHIDKLVELHISLKNILLDTQKFAENKKQFFFKNYIKSIKFFPNFQRFGLGQYYLYLYPSDMNKLDFKLLFTNTFQKIKYPACIDNSNSLLIKYIIPHGAPQLKYLHWLTKSKKVIREYCSFFIKKAYHILHFSYNLSSEGWVYNKDKFKMHMQNILFKPSYNFQIPEIKEYIITDEFISSYFGPNSPEFESLSQIYNWKSIDIKSFLRTKKAITVNHINNLLEKGLIFPYLSLKNLDLHDKVYVIIPNLKPELNTTLVKIFSFFNFAFVYETEGEYFIYGFEQEKKYQNGLMIKIYFPKCEISEFIRLFDLLFEYLEIKDYLILNDLVDGKNLIKSIYGGLAFLDSYNPLKNLEWNEQDKIWQNPKIFTSKFKPIYPDLISKDK